MLSGLSLVLALCADAHAATYTQAGDTIGAVTTYKVQKNDHVSFIARRFDIGLVELLAANPGLTQKNLKAGQTLTLPTAYVLPQVQEGIVINLPALRLFYFVGDGTVMTFPLGIGREGWSTPTGETTLTLKRKDPTWIPPESIREEDPKLPDIVPPGPKNPLGAYALNLGLPGIRIHGTNSPYSIGKRASHGCIRLYPEDIEALFNAVAVGIPVTLIDTPYTVGWQGDKLMLQVMPTQEQDDAIAAYQTPKPVSLPDLHAAIAQVAGAALLGNGDTVEETSAAKINWDAVDKAAAAHNFLPVVIGKKPAAPQPDSDQ